MISWMDGIGAFTEVQAAETTRAMYRSDLADLARDRDGAEVNDAAAVSWIRSLEARRLDPATIARKISVARSFFEHLRKKRIVDTNPFADIKPPKVDRSEGKTPCLAKREVELLLGVMDPKNPYGLRDRAIAFLLFGCGLRVSTVARLRKDEIATEDGYAVIRVVGKGGRLQKSVLAPDVEAVLREHIQRNAPHGEWVFRAMPTNARYHESVGRDPRTRPLTRQSILAGLKRWARAAGLDEKSVRCHSGRVFFVTEAYRRTHDLERVARAVGHSSLGTTRRYLRYLERPEDHAALAVKLTPREPALRRPNDE